MEKTLFASDLDNTLLFSYKHAQPGDLCVEYLEGAAQGYLTGETPELLARIMEKALFVPVTSRSMEQYLRISFPQTCRPRYAVTTNGAFLLVDGKPDPQWTRVSEEMVAPWRPHLEETLRALEVWPAPKRCRIVDGMFTFAACDTPEDAQALGEALKGAFPLDAGVTGRKVYFFPPPINKGAALDRLRHWFGAERVLCAGDSPIDAPMLGRADLAIAPQGILPEEESPARREWDGSGRFYTFVLQQVLRDLNGGTTC